MIDRRSILLAGAGLGANLVLPAAARAMAGLPPVDFDLIDCSIWANKGDVPAPALIYPGGFLLPEHLTRRRNVHLLTALLSPANAMLLTEYLRFDLGVTVVEHLVSAEMAAMTRADARMVTVRWTDACMDR